MFSVYKPSTLRLIAPSSVHTYQREPEGSKGYVLRLRSFVCESFAVEPSPVGSELYPATRLNLTGACAYKGNQIPKNPIHYYYYY